MRIWKLKDVCQKAKVTARALHYYDKIRLLKPMARLPNGYRVYSEGAILKLQKITALKFFGFSLSHIVKLLVKDTDDAEVLPNLKTQLNALRLEISHIEEMQIRLLTLTIEALEQNKEVDWYNTVELMEKYKKAKNLKKKILVQKEI